MSYKILSLLSYYFVYLIFESNSYLIYLYYFILFWYNSSGYLNSSLFNLITVIKQ